MELLKQKRKLQQMKNKQFFITLPRPIVNAKEWKKGEELFLVLTNSGDIILKK